MIFVQAEVVISDVCWPGRENSATNYQFAGPQIGAYPRPPSSPHHTRYYSADVRHKHHRSLVQLRIACHLFQIESNGKLISQASCFASLDSDNVIGQALLVDEENETHMYLSRIDNFEVRNSQYKGIGAALMAASLDLATNCGFDGIFLIAMDSSRFFYKKLGLTKNGIYYDAGPDLLESLAQRANLQYLQ